MTKKKIFFASVHSPDRAPEEIIIDKRLTIGEAQECNIRASIPGVQGKQHSLIERHRSDYILYIPQNADGTITIGTSTLPIKGIIRFGLLKKKGGSYLFTLPDNNTCIVNIGNISLTFGYKEIIIPSKPKIEAVKLDRSLKRPLIAREDYSFLLILSLSAIIQFTTAGYLSTLEIKKKDPLQSIKDMPHRFARLILQPPKKEVIKKPQAAPTPDEEKKEEEKKEPEKHKEAEKKEEEKKELEKPRDAEKKKEEEVASITQPQPLITREQIREKVKSRGLLGLITAKSMPVNIPDSAIFHNIDDRMKGVKERRAGRRVEDILASLDIKDSKSMEDDISGDIGGITQGTAGPRDIGEIVKEKKNVQIEETAKGEAMQATIAAAGKRNESEVYRVIQSYIGGLKYLYNNALKKDPSLRGKVTVRLVIAIDGKIKEAGLMSSTLNAPELEEAIINRVYKWRFTEMQEGEEFITNYTFDFTPVG